MEDTAGMVAVRRVRLQDSDGNDITSQREAEKELKRLQVKAEDKTTTYSTQCPTLRDYSKTYFAWHEAVKDAKRASTVGKERSAMTRWNAHMGNVRLDRIRKPMITEFIAKRQKAGISGRTCNLDVIMLRNVLKKAIDDGHLQDLPTRGMRPLKWTSKRRELVPQDQIEAICKAASKPAYFDGRLAKKGEKGGPLKNAQQFSDFVRLLALTGARRGEAMRLRWGDVDFKQRQLHVGSDSLAKNREHRTVDFSTPLKKHLEAMLSRRQPDTDWIFPSPQRGEKDIHAKTFEGTKRLAREAAGLPEFGFHDCRHAFISYAVMSGIDYMTIAKWVGHKDGGVLIGKVYGHLANEHRQAMARKMNFGTPQIVDSGAGDDADEDEPTAEQGNGKGQ